MNNILLILLVFLGLWAVVKICRLGSAPEQSPGASAAGGWAESSGPVADLAEMDELNRGSRLKRVEILTRF